jgi:nondiscriminating glutamyl-tRNA synthetase
MIQTKTIRTRFAPSPTGFVHIGSLRTALFAFLFARSKHGTNLLRIEDTDQNRLVEGSLENMLSVFQTMGIEFDEGPYVENGKIKQKGEYGSYIQSERKEQGLYQKYAEQLVAEKKAYYCFCSEERLDEMRKEQVALKKPPMYDRRCRNLTADDIQKQLADFSARGGSASGGKASGKNPVIRFAIPLEGSTVIHDLIYGDIIYENKFLDDQIILKADGFPTYHLAVVVDDHFMEISHVIRGEEWIPSTPKHLLIYEALGWQPTEFAHLPLIVNPDKTKLSKRQGDVAVEDYLKAGYSPEVLINFIVMLGWNPKTEQEIFSLQQLIDQFDLAKVNKSNAVLDKNKLDWISGQYIKTKTGKEIAELLKPFWQEAGIKVAKFSEEYLKAIAALEKERLKKLSEIGERTKYFFEAPDYDASLLIWKKSDKEKTKQALSDLVILFENMDLSAFAPDFAEASSGKKATADDPLHFVSATAETIEKWVKKMIADKNYDNGSVLWPLRTSLTGLDKSPGPFEVAATLTLGLGKEEIIKRLNTAVVKLS